MADEDSKKQIEQEMAQQQDAIIKQQAEEQQAIEQAENAQESANIELSNEEEILAAQQQEAQEDESQQSESSSVPMWMKEAVYFTLKYESNFGELEEGQQQNLLSEASSTLGQLAENGIIQAYEETVDGVKALMNMEGGKSVSFNLSENSVSSNDLSSNVLNTITSVVSAVGGNNLDLSELKDSSSRYDAYKMANEQNFDVKGLDEGEKDNFEKTASLSKKL